MNRRLDDQAEILLAAAGQGTVVDNLTTMLTDLFGSVAVAIVSLTISRDGLRARLREAVPTGVPILSEAGRVIMDYLTAEQTYGRIPADADLNTLGLTLIGCTHLLFADSTGARPTHEAVRRHVRAVLPTT